MHADLERALAGLGAVDPGEREAAFAEIASLTMIFVRAAMGRRLRDHRESVDVCQSIAASFAADVEAGRVRFDSAAALGAYLKQVVRTKLAILARHDGADKRSSPLPIASISDDSAPLRRADVAPSYQALEQDAYSRLIGALSPEDQELLRLRGAGVTWERIAEHTGRNPAALRQQFSRAQRRVVEELGSLGEED